MQVKLIHAKVRSSPPRLGAFSRCCILHGLPPLKPPIDVDIRWKSTWAVLTFGYKYREALTSFVELDRKLDTETYTLTADEWDHVSLLFPVLEVCGHGIFCDLFSHGSICCDRVYKFKDAVNFYSLSMATYPVLPLSIAAYNFLMDKLEDWISKEEENDWRFKDDLLAGMYAARAKLQKWYARTKRPVYGNAMCECFQFCDVASFDAL